MIAFHYPPVGMSSGVHRTLAFSRYLREHGWEPIVLSIDPSVFSQLSDDQLKDIPDNLHVERAAGFDSAKRFNIGGYYPQLLALPDRWVSWYFGGVNEGMRLIEQYKPQAIWSTYPIATAQLIALRLQKWSSLPWVADFRDSMVDDSYPETFLQRAAFKRIERKVVNRAAACVFTTNGTLRLYKKRYPTVNEAKWKLIANGFDEEAFQDAERLVSREYALPLQLIHSGLLSLSDRDPRPFFSALSELKKEGELSALDVQFVFRASSNDELLIPLIRALGIEDLVILKKTIAYRLGLSEILGSDGLLLFQSANCNHQIPAKAYEYIRAKRPIFALTDESGNTAKMLHDAGVGEIADISSVSSIKKRLLVFIANIGKTDEMSLSDAEIDRYSRKASVGKLADILNQLT